MSCSHSPAFPSDTAEHRSRRLSWSFAPVHAALFLAVFALTLPDAASHGKEADAGRG